MMYKRHFPAKVLQGFFYRAEEDAYIYFVGYYYKGADIRSSRMFPKRQKKTADIYAALDAECMAHIKKAIRRGKPKARHVTPVL